MKKQSMFAILAIALLCSMVGVATAATVTQNINYQGRLTDSSGNPLTGTYSMTFKLYTVPTGGSDFWHSTQSVQCENGIFTVSLPVDHYDFRGGALWLGITVAENFLEMTPRQEIRPVPYALSLRPNSWIAATGSDYALHLVKNEDTGGALTIGSADNNQEGILIGVYGTNSRGIKLETSGTGSYGVDILTDASNGRGINITTKKPDSPGIYAETRGDNSQGFAANTYGNSGSHGIDVFTRGSGSYGIKAQASGPQAHAVWGQATGTEANGVVAYSTQWTAIYADTSRADQKYGLYTPDYIYAGGTEVPSSDIAEYIPVTEDVEPGTVMIIGENGVLQVSTIAYDTRVAGIVSTHPGVSLGTKDTGNPGEEQIAIAGRVPCKVDATKTPIHAGDLLTTSDKPGHAMKATDAKIGTVVGKAMGTIENGTGVIEVLVMLQ